MAPRHISRKHRALALSAAGIALAATTLTGCSNTNAHSNSASKSTYAGISIAFVSGPLNDSFFPPLYNGAKQAASDLGVKLKYIPIDEADIEKSSVTTMQTAIAARPSAIVVGDFVTSAVDPLIKTAVGKGIPVFVNQSGQSSWKADGALGFVGQDGRTAGTVAGQQMIKNGAKNVLCVDNVPGNPYLTDVCNGMKSAVQGAGASASQLNLPTADSTDPTKVTADVGAYLKSHPAVDSVFALNAAVGTYALNASKTVGNGKKYHIGSLELSKVALNDVKAGDIDFLLSEQPYLDGYFGVLFATQYAKYGLAPVGQVSTGPQVIDKSNINSVIATTKKYPNILGSD